jgi:cobalt-zinc-cadmium resistance protein CzcA
LLLVNCQFFNAQTPINLQSAIDTALKNNLTIKNEKLRSQYQQKLIKTSASIPQTNVSGEYGQINSYYTDNRIGISQSFNFPTVYSNQKKLLTEEWKTSVLNISLKEADTKKMVRQVFYTYLYLKEKEDLLLKNDSIYAKFLERANLRFST